MQNICYGLSDCVIQVYRHSNSMLSPSFHCHTTHEAFHVPQSVTYIYAIMCEVLWM